MHAMKRLSFLLILILLFSCKKKVDPVLLIQGLEKAVQQHSYFYESGPAFSDETFEAAAKEVNPELPWNPGQTPQAALAKRISEAPADLQNDLMRRAFNTLLGGTEGETGRRNYFVGGDTVSRLNDAELNSGAGIVLYRESYGRFRIVDVLEGSAAHLAGIPQGGLLEKIDNRPVIHLELEDVVALIRGKSGTPVKLSIDGKQYDLVRGQYSVQLLRRSEWDLNGKRALYIELRSAAKGAARDLETMLLKGNNPDLLILDLRKLNQGDFDEAFTIADLFVANHELGVIRRKDIAPRPVSSDANILYSGKIYVMVSNRTSPHVKTLAMALRRSDRVKFIGPDLHLRAYAGTQIPLGPEPDDGYAMIVEAVIEPVEGQSDQLRPEISAEDYIPVNPPSNKPDENDPCHAALLKTL